MDISKYVLQAPGMLLITESTDPVAYFGVLWTDAVTPFAITIEDYFGEESTFNIDKFTPAICPRKVLDHATFATNKLYLLHQGNRSIEKIDHTKENAA